jgi:hypothetical protein
MRMGARLGPWSAPIRLVGETGRGRTAARLRQEQIQVAGIDVELPVTPAAPRLCGRMPEPIALIEDLD